MLERAKADNDCFLLPDAKNVFNSWTPNETETFSGEKVIKMTTALHLYGPFPGSDEVIVRGAKQVFDYSRMEGDFFQPDDRICILISNINYDELRETP